MAERHRQLDREERGVVHESSKGSRKVGEDCELIQVPQRPEGHGSDMT